jgi:putative ABC transport system permease protein
VLGVTAPPWGGFEPSRTAGTVRKLMLPEGTDAAGDVVATVALADYTLSLPLEQAGTSAQATVPLELLAALRTGFERRIAWDEQQRELILGRTGFFGFRLYAPTIDLVPGLYRHLVGQDLKVEAHVQEIERIQVLDRGLLRLFLLIATVGAIGGSGAMVASLYAAVDRKKRDLGVMRLMGLSRTDVSQFPVYQGLALSAVAITGAAGTFLLFSAFINTSFAGEVIKGGKICDLPPMYYIYAAAFTVTAALFSSLVAARRATRIEPAEAIREE